MTNKSRTLYIGVTNDLERRVLQHKKKLVRGFTSKYNITALVWFEEFHDVTQAIEAEKKLKGWLRSKKVALIKANNSGWRDLAGEWYEQRAVERPADHSGDAPSECRPERAFPRHPERSEGSPPSRG